MNDSGDTITITGNVATAPELKRVSGGVAITTFRVARTLRRFDKDAGAWSDAGTNWYTVSVFRALAEHAFASLRVGDRVILTGRLRLRDWDNGTRRGTAAEIDADAIGHDLRWGTTTFVKGTRNPSAADAEWPAVANADAWTAPGVDAGDASPGTADADARPLVLAGGSRDDASAVTSEEPPF